jgi:hypothetical protein
MEDNSLGPWFRMQGLSNLEQVVDYIIELQKKIQLLLDEKEQKRINAQDVKE